ncbi:MAG: hypothetical protein M1305_00540 [Candidatus Marsarchaeota archaeon]|nr:hypothetical protein [Candidatus Marsarchaeota archaeon]
MTGQKAREQSELDTQCAQLVLAAKNAGVEVPSELREEGPWVARRRQIYAGLVTTVAERNKAIEVVREQLGELNSKVRANKSAWVQKTAQELVTRIENLQAALQQSIPSDEVFLGLEKSMKEAQRQADALTSEAESHRAEAEQIQAVKQDYLVALEQYEKATDQLKEIYTHAGFEMAQLDPLLRECFELRTLFANCDPHDEESLLRARAVFEEIKQKGSGLRGVYEQRRATFIQLCLQKSSEKASTLDSIQRSGLLDTSVAQRQLSSMISPPDMTAIGSEIGWANKLFEFFPSIDEGIRTAQQLLAEDVGQLAREWPELISRAAVVGKPIDLPDVTQVTWDQLPQAREQIRSTKEWLQTAEVELVNQAKQLRRYLSSMLSTIESSEAQVAFTEEIKTAREELGGPFNTAEGLATLRKSITDISSKLPDWQDSLKTLPTPHRKRSMETSEEEMVEDEMETIEEEAPPPRRQKPPLEGEAPPQ